jgi:hypothetical protein
MTKHELQKKGMLDLIDLSVFFSKLDSIGLKNVINVLNLESISTKLRCIADKLDGVDGLAPFLKTQAELKDLIEGAG